MVPPGTMLPNQMQPNLTVMAPPKPEDTIVVCVIVLHHRQYVYCIILPVQNNVSASDIKVATTVFVGNISEKATDTLIRQILLVSRFGSSMYICMHTVLVCILYLYVHNQLHVWDIV